MPPGRVSAIVYLESARDPRRLAALALVTLQQQLTAYRRRRRPEILKTK